MPLVKASQVNQPTFSNIVWQDQEIKSAFYKIATRIQSSLERLNSGSLTFNYNGKPTKAVSADVIRIVSELPQNDPLELALRNIILEGVVSSEDHSVGSGYIFLNAIVSGYFPEFEQGKIRADLKDTLETIRHQIGGGICYNIIKSILEQGAIDSKVDFVITDRDPVFSVRIDSSMKIIGDFHDLFNVNRRKISSSFVVAIDGIIESLGEVDCLLQSAADSKQNVLMISRGFAPDVVSTLQKNYKNKNMFVFPFVASGDEDLYTSFRDAGLFVVDRDSYLSLRTLSIDDLNSGENDIFLDDYMIRLGGVKSTSRNITISVPSIFKDSIRLIHDRIVIAVRCAKETCRTGTCIDTKTGKKVSIKSARNAKNVTRATRKILKNLGCLVLQQE